MIFLKNEFLAMKSVNIFLLGFGGVGRALARQIVEARERHKTRNQLALNIVGLVDSTSAMIDANGLSDESITRAISAKTQTGRLPVDQTQPASIITAFPTNAIVVDTTASAAAMPMVLAALSAGGGYVTANKLPVAGKLAWWDAISRSKARWETTCGAALPVISTLNTLLDSGDEVHKIEGCLSGTLGYLSSELERGTPFGDAVRTAKQLGYTEPDPRQDLGGLDVARKALILARMLGYRLEMNDVQAESLYPASMDGLSMDEFLREVDTLNQLMAERAASLMAGGKKLRYAATIEDGKLAVGLIGAAPDSKLGSTRASDSIVAFHTKYFNDNPLAVSGRGAGQEVTASGVLGDIVSLAKEISVTD